MTQKHKDIIQTAAFALILFLVLGLQIILPKADYAAGERRKLSGFPDFSLKTVISGKFMEGFESYATDNIAFRESFRKVKAFSALHFFLRRDNHGIYLADRYAAKMEYPLKTEEVEFALDKLKQIGTKYLDKSNTAYLALIPDKNAFLAEKTGHLSLDYQKIEQMAYESLDFAQPIPLYPLLCVEDFYYSDTHWRQEKLLSLAEEVARQMQIKLDWNWRERCIDTDFLGVYAGQAALPMLPESLKYLYSPELEDCSVWDLQNDRPIPTYDLKLGKGRDGYEMFLSGSLSLIKIENPKAPANKKLILFRDSFGSSFAPLLFPAYSEIYLVDIRYLPSNRLDQLIDFKNADILFLYSHIVLNQGKLFR